METHRAQPVLIARFRENHPSTGSAPLPRLSGRTDSARWRYRSWNCVRAVNQWPVAAVYSPGYSNPLDWSSILAAEALINRKTTRNKEVKSMSIANVMPDSGIQLLIVVGAAFLMAGVHSSLGMNLLLLGVGAWAVYNVINIGRQF